jgi:cation/acetate symporter
MIRIRSRPLANQVTDDERRERTGLDGRIAFAAAAFAFGAGLIVLLDRVGLPQNVSILGGFLLATGIACAIGMSVRSVRISTFYAAGRSVPATYGGLAGAACLAGVAIIFLPPLPESLSMQVIGLGLAGGLVGLTVLSAPVMRKSGAFSPSDLMAVRFPARGFRLMSIMVIASACGLTALAGFEQAIRLLTLELGIGRIFASMIVGFILIFLIVPGGLAGFIWSAAGAGGMLLVSLLLPLTVLALRGSELPLPFFGGAEIWAHASKRVGDWTQFAGAPEPSYWLALPIALGIAGFAPLLSLGTASRNRAGAQRTQIAMFAWLIAIVAMIVIIMAATALSLDVALLGQRPDRLADQIYRASSEGWLHVCGRVVDGPAPARAACAAVPDFAAVLRPNDFSVSAAYLVFGLADLRELGGAYRGLTSASLFVACLALASAGLQGVCTALGHDLYYRVRERFAITSRRLAITRLLLLLAVVGAGVGAAHGAFDPRMLIGLALAISAVGVLPLLLLALWPRAGSLEASLALIAGLGVASGLLFKSSMLRVVLAEDLGQAAVIGSATALCVGILVSLRRGATSEAGIVFVDTLMHGRDDSLNADRGA